MLSIKNKVSLITLFPTIAFKTIKTIDMSSQSNFFGNDTQHEDVEAASNKINTFQKKHPNALLANGYLEERSFYNTPNFERVYNGQKEYRNIHLGTDFWLPSGTPVHTPYEGRVVISYNNNYHKDYGPLLVIKHTLPEATFYTLYGHLSEASLTISPKDKKVEQGQYIGTLGDEKENGNWAPHLHFQVITDLLENDTNYNGVAFASEIDLWKKRCPNPSFIFKEDF